MKCPIIIQAIDQDLLIPSCAVTSVIILAKVLVRSPPKMYIYIIKNHICRIKVPQKNVLFDLENGNTGCSRYVSARMRAIMM